MAHPTTDTIRARKIMVWISRAISYVVYFYLIAVEIILGLGFFLLLFGANPSAGFTEWVYRNLERVMEPFRGIFTPIQLGTTDGNVPSILETSVLFAMIIYGIIAMVFSSLTNWLNHRMRALEIAEAEAERREEQEQLAAVAQLGTAAAPPASTPYPTVTPPGPPPR
jgi:hypothetical protein